MLLYIYNVKQQFSHILLFNEQGLYINILNRELHTCMHYLFRYSNINVDFVTLDLKFNNNKHICQNRLNSQYFIWSHHILSNFHRLYRILQFVKISIDVRILCQSNIMKSLYVECKQAWENYNANQQLVWDWDGHQD